MTEVVAFDSHQQMVEYLRQAAHQAHAGLHVVQDNLTWGDTWVQFVDVTNRHVAFGQIATIDEVHQGELDSSGSADDADAVAAMTRSDLEYGYMYGRVFDRFNPEGELGTTHKASVWPIEERVFQAAHAVGFVVDDLPLWAKFNLHVAQLARRAHLIGLGA